MTKTISKDKIIERQRKVIEAQDRLIRNAKERLKVQDEQIQLYCNIQIKLRKQHLETEPN